MKIYWLLTDDDGGISVELFADETARDAAAFEWLNGYDDDQHYEGDLGLAYEAWGKGRGLLDLDCMNWGEQDITVEDNNPMPDIPEGAEEINYTAHGQWPRRRWHKDGRFIAFWDDLSQAECHDEIEFEAMS